MIRSLILLFVPLILALPVLAEEKTVYTFFQQNLKDVCEEYKKVCRTFDDGYVLVTIDRRYFIEEKQMKSPQTRLLAINLTRDLILSNGVYKSIESPLLQSNVTHQYPLPEDIRSRNMNLVEELSSLGIALVVVNDLYARIDGRVFSAFQILEDRVHTLGQELEVRGHNEIPTDSLHYYVIYGEEIINVIEAIENVREHREFFLRSLEYISRYVASDSDGLILF